MAKEIKFDIKAREELKKGVDELANALEKLYPQTDLSVLEYDELRDMVAKLDGFDDSSVPDDDDLEAVIHAWVGIQFPEDAEKIPSENID